MVQRCAVGSRRAIQARTKGARRAMKWARLMDLPQCYATPMGRHPAELGCPETVNPTGFDAGGVPMLRSQRFEARFVDKAVSRGLQTATRDHRSKIVDKFACGMFGQCPEWVQCTLRQWQELAGSGDQYCGATRPHQGFLWTLRASSQTSSGYPSSHSVELGTGWPGSTAGKFGSSDTGASRDTISYAPSDRALKANLC